MGRIALAKRGGKDTLSPALSFRGRLLAALLLILVVPIGAIGVLLFALPGESREGISDARLAGALPAVIAGYDERLDQARAEATTMAMDPVFARALAEGDRPRIETELRKRRPLFAEVHGPNGQLLASVGVVDPIATASVRARADGRLLGRIVVSELGAEAFVDRVARETTLEAILVEGDEAISATVDAGDVKFGSKVPASRDISLPDGKFRARVVELPDTRRDLRLALLGPRGAAKLSGGQAAVGVLLGIFVLVALGLIVPLLRQLQLTHEKTAEEAGTDPLTGLANQRRLHETIEREIRRSGRFGRPLSLLMLDLDDFKQVNDAHGHLRGDEVLREVAALLVGESREVDEPGRYGGEEFVVVLPETTTEGAAEMAERVRARVEDEIVHTPGGKTLTASIGIATLPTHAADYRGLIAAADSALYGAKRQGKNRVFTANGGNA
jgi:diguanylate cyclase (GGDEF)-like protein